MNWKWLHCRKFMNEKKSLGTAFVGLLSYWLLSIGFIIVIGQVCPKESWPSKKIPDCNWNRKTSVERQGCFHGFHPTGLQGIASSVHQSFGRAWTHRMGNQLLLPLCHGAERKRSGHVYQDAEPLQCEQRYPWKTWNQRTWYQLGHLSPQIVGPFVGIWNFCTPCVSFSFSANCQSTDY